MRATAHDSRYAHDRSGLFVPRDLAREPDLVPAHHVGDPTVPSWRRSLRGHRFVDPALASLAAAAERVGARASTQGWVETVALQRAAGTLFTTYTAAKSVINADALWDSPRNFFTIQKMLRLTVTGAISNIVTTPGLMNFQLKVGGVAAFDTGNIQLNATAHTTLPFWLDILITCQAIGSGAAAKLIGLAQATGRMFTNTAGQTDSAQDMPTILAPAIAPAQGTGFDSTIVNLIDFWTGFTISNAGNGVQIHQYLLQALN